MRIVSKEVSQLRLTKLWHLPKNLRKEKDPLKL